MVRQRHNPHDQILTHHAHALMTTTQGPPLWRRAEHSEESRSSSSSTPSAGTASLHDGDIAGIVIGAVAAAGLLVAVGFVWLWLVKRQRFVHPLWAETCATNDRRGRRLQLPPGMHELPVDHPPPSSHASDEPAYPSLAGCPAPAPAHTKSPWHAPPAMDDIPQSYSSTGYEYGTGYDSTALGTVGAAPPPALVAPRSLARTSVPASNGSRHSLLSWETATGSPSEDTDLARPESPGSFAPFFAHLRSLGSSSENMSSHNTQYHSWNEEHPPSTVYHPAASYSQSGHSFFSPPSGVAPPGRPGS